MYGMGNGADKIIAVCERYGIEISDFFASDGFVRGHSFHGKVVLSYSQMKEKYGPENVIVLLSFASSLPDVLDNIKKIADECELYAPDVPVAGNNLFNMEFAHANAGKIELAYSLLSDEDSKKTFENVIYYKLTGDIKYLFKVDADAEATYKKFVLSKKINTFFDLGAYNGDTVRELLRYEAPERIVAFEPDRRNFRKLSQYLTDTDAQTNITAIKAGAWNKSDILEFDSSGNRNAGFISVSKAERVRVETVDNIVFDNGLSSFSCEEIAVHGEAPASPFCSVDYIKYDVEGAEDEALDGSERTIRAFSPTLLVSLYHRSEDIFELIIKVHEINPSYKLYFRKLPYVPAWDLNLYAIK
jgi:FkbM family methyltransferase